MEDDNIDGNYYNNNKQNEQNQDDKTKIMELILSNLKAYVQKSYEPALEELKALLNLKKIPHIIDCFDISNFGNDFAVGACTRFMDGVPYKNGYRRFRIKKTLNQDDFSMMEEIISRRYRKNEEIETEKEVDDNTEKTTTATTMMIEELPNLIVIDGGKGHLNVALKTLKRMGLEKKLECVSLAKENEEIFVPSSNYPIIISKNKKSLKILQHIRDESHRFGLTYNRKLRKILVK
jgi:excinuclease ABC subunit C